LVQTQTQLTRHAENPLRLIEGGLACVEQEESDTPGRSSHVVSLLPPPASGATEDLVLARGGCTLRRASTAAQCDQASLLIKNMYEWRGYISDKAATLSRHSDLVTL
jgi:hypothetical protein